MEVAGVLLGVVGVFAECVQGYQVLVSIRTFSGDVATLFWKLKTQQLRLDIWGRQIGLPEQEALGDASWAHVRDGAGAKLPSQLSPATLRFIEGILQRICEILQDAQALNNRYGLAVVHPKATATSTQKIDNNSRLKLPTAKLRWVLSDRVAFEKLLGDLKDLNDGLYTTLALSAFQQAQYTLANEMPRATDSVEELQQIRQVSTENETLQAVASLKQLCIETSSSNGSRVDVSELEIAVDKVEVFPAFPEDDMRSLCVADQAGQRRYALVEWKHYDAQPDQDDASTSATLRMKRLIRLLNQQPKPQDLRTLDCIGYIHNRYLRAVGLLLAFPWAEGYISATSPQSGIQPGRNAPWINLHALITQTKRLPLLEQRFSLALALAKSMMQLHATGWLHKGFRSSNVIFIRPNAQSTPEVSTSQQQSSTDQPTNTSDIDIRQPIIIGFEYTRPNQTAEHSDQISPSILLKPYLHPEYHDANRQLPSSQAKTKRYTANYDMYSLGCVLLEIGLWRRLTDYWRPEYEDAPLAEWRARVLKKLVPDLGGRCGGIYEGVVRDLLSRTEDDGARVPHMTNFEIQQALAGLVV